MTRRTEDDRDLLGRLPMPTHAPSKFNIHEWHREARFPLCTPDRDHLQLDGNRFHWQDQVRSYRRSASSQKVPSDCRNSLREAYSLN